MKSYSKELSKEQTGQGLCNVTKIVSQKYTESGLKLDESCSWHK